MNCEYSVLLDSICPKSMHLYIHCPSALSVIPGLFHIDLALCTYSEWPTHMELGHEGKKHRSWISLIHLHPAALSPIEVQHRFAMADGLLIGAKVNSLRIHFASAFDWVRANAKYWKCILIFEEAAEWGSCTSAGQWMTFSSGCNRGSSHNEKNPCHSMNTGSTLGVHFYAPCSRIP